MAFTIMKSGLKNGLMNYCLFVCDDESDIPVLPNSKRGTQNHGICSVGSEAIVVSTRKKYILNSNDEWKLLINYASQGSGTATVEVEDDGEGNVYIV